MFVQIKCAITSTPWSNSTVSNTRTFWFKDFNLNVSRICQNICQYVSFEAAAVCEILLAKMLLSYFEWFSGITI